MGTQDEDKDSGGKSGEVKFRFKTEIYRDDQLPPHELQRLIRLHEEAHKIYVEKQKTKRKEKTFLKEGRKDLVSQHKARFGAGHGGGGQSHFKKHPISDLAQFSGIDIKEFPSENNAETNLELQNKLENRYNHKFQPTRQFNPKPRPY